MLAGRCGTLSVLFFVKGHIFSIMTAVAVFRAFFLPGALPLNVAMTYFSWNGGREFEFQQYPSNAKFCFVLGNF